MKNTLYLSASLAFSLLFYRQFMGLNALIFALVVIVSMAMLLNPKEDIKRFSVLSGLFLLSAFAVFLYGNTLAVIAYFTIFGVFVFLVHQKSLSLITGLLALFSTPILAFVRKLKKKEPEKKAHENIKNKKKINVFAILIPIAILLVFFTLYRSISNEFRILTDKINLDFITWGWIWFTVFGFLLMYPVFYFIKRQGFERFEQAGQQPIQRPIKRTLFASFMRLKWEYIAAFYSLVLLNLMLVTVNVLDVLNLYLGVHLTTDMSASESVHYGVGNLIWTILVSISVILMFYNDRLNFIRQNRILNIITIGWLAQNLLLVVSTAYRNYSYIVEMGLTYKRIGVYVYLLLTLVGLLITIRKVNFKLKFWQMLREFTATAVVFLVLASLVNWNKMVVRSQLAIAQQEGKTLDCAYLDTKMPIAKLYVDNYEHLCSNNAFMYYHGNPFLKEYKKHDWRSFVYRDYLLYKKLKAEKSD